MIKDYLDEILDGSKTFDARSYPTNKRGTIALVDSRTMKVYGYVDLIGVREISPQEYASWHCTGKWSGCVMQVDSTKKYYAWDVLKNFDHALILREDDPLLPAVLEVYEKQGIRNGARTNTMKGVAFENELCKAYPECRLVVTKETMTVEGMIKIVYSLLKDKLNIVRLTFTSGVNAATETYEVKETKDRCPLCGILLDENGVCPTCGYRK